MSFVSLGCLKTGNGIFLDIGQKIGSILLHLNGF
jgi:hypothetical protein